MGQKIETISFRTTTRDLMQIKDAYNLFETKSAIKFLFEQQFKNKVLLLDEGFNVEPDHINMDAVVITVKARQA